MRTILSRWFLFALLVGWALTHATVFGQSTSKTTTPADKLRAGLDKIITVDYSGQTFENVLNHIGDKAGLPIEIDQNVFASMQIAFMPGGDPALIQVKAKNEKASQLLRKFLKTYHLTYIIFEDSILVTTEEMAATRQYRQRVSVDLEDVPLKKAVRDLAKNHGINLVIDPKVKNQAETAVSLQLEDVGLETTLRLLAELASLKAVRMGSVTFVTSEETAKKIRKEEKQQQSDDPSNPYAYPPVMLGPPPPPFRVGPGIPLQANPNAGPAPGIELPTAPPEKIAPPIPKAPAKGQSTPGAPAFPPPPILQRPAVDGVPAPISIPRVIRN